MDEGWGMGVGWGWGWRVPDRTDEQDGQRMEDGHIGATSETDMILINDIESELTACS